VSLPNDGSVFWRPTMQDTWQYQLTGYPVDERVAATVFIVDLFDVPKGTIASLHRKGRKVICYFSAGTWENWRPDAGRYPRDMLGNPLEAFPDERWVDIRQIALLAPILEDRVRLCREKGFDGVDPDNLDGFIHETGFPLTAADQLRFNRMVADMAHRAGLAVGLKNDLTQVAALVEAFDWATNEACFQFGECRLLMPFIQNGKPVVNVEYRGDPKVFCPRANQRGFFSMKKRRELDAFRIPCR